MYLSIGMSFTAEAAFHNSVLRPLGRMLQLNADKLLMAGEAVSPIRLGEVLRNVVPDGLPRRRRGERD